MNQCVWCGKRILKDEVLCEPHLAEHTADRKRWRAIKESGTLPELRNSKPTENRSEQD